MSSGQGLTAKPDFVRNTNTHANGDTYSYAYRDSCTLHYLHHGYRDWHNHSWHRRHRQPLRRLLDSFHFHSRSAFTGRPLTA